MNIKQTLKKHKNRIIGCIVLSVIAVCAIATQYILLYILLIAGIMLLSYFSEDLSDLKQPENVIYIIVIFIMILPFFIGFIMLLFTRNTTLQIKHIKGDQWLIIFSALIAYFGTTSLGYLAFLQNNRLNKINSDLAQDTKDKSNREIADNERVKTNYIFQINAEMLLNSGYYVDMLYFYRPEKKSLKYKALKLFMTHISDIVWRQINSEAAKYLPKELMEEVVGYYAGVYNIKTFWYVHIDLLPKIDVKSLEDIIKGQLKTYLKCLDMMEKELGRELRKNNRYEYDKNYFTINKDTGDIEDVQ